MDDDANNNNNNDGECQVDSGSLPYSNETWLIVGGGDPRIPYYLVRDTLDGMAQERGYPSRIMLYPFADAVYSWAPPGIALEVPVYQSNVLASSVCASCNVVVVFAAAPDTKPVADIINYLKYRNGYRAYLVVRPPPAP